MGQVDVHIWDNSGVPTPGMDEVIAAYSQFSWHLGSTNIGFAAAVNALARTVPEHDLLLLNPDAVLQGALSGTLAALRKPGVAAAAPLVVDANAKHGRSCPWDVAHREKNLTRALVAYAGYSDRIRGRRWSEHYQTRPTVVAGYLTGACLAISRDAWDAVGPFDEEFFLYGEEEDWQRRARFGGWSLQLVDEPGIAHTGHGTVANDLTAAVRSGDLLRTNIALNLELERGRRTADLFLAGTSILHHVQRSTRRYRAARRRPAGPRPSVIITTNRLVPGGSELQRVLLARELDRRGYEVVIACMERFGPLVAEIPSSIRVVRQPWWAPVIDVGAGQSIVISGDSDVETRFAMLWRASGKGRRWLVSAHSQPNEDGPTYSRGLAAAMRRSDGFITPSKRHWNALTAHQRLGTRSFTAAYGVAAAADLAEVPRRCPDAAAPQLVMISRPMEHENQRVLIDALDGLHELPWRLSIFGDGPDEALRALIPPDLADRVRWPDCPLDREQVFADCDLLCVPDNCHASSIVVLEAMARRIPVAASAGFAVNGVLDEGAGLLVIDNSVEGWRTAIGSALRQVDKWKAMGEKGFERMNALYTVDAMADAYESAIAAVSE